MATLGDSLARTPPPHVIVLVGDIDMADGPRLIGHLCACALSGARDVEVDLTDVTFFGSTGLNFLVRLRRLVEPRGGRVTLTGANEFTCSLLHLDGFADGFNVEASFRP